MRVPVIVMVLAATAIPVELRPISHAPLNVVIQAGDVLSNIAGYVPVGVVLATLGPLRAVITAFLLATCAEAGQLVMMHRDPSIIDVASNVIGALLGAVINGSWKIRPPSFSMNRRRALVAATLAVALMLGLWVTSGDALNPRGAVSPGSLEAHWKLDESSGRVALDSSGHRLNGRFRNEPTRVRGVAGDAVSFDGARDYIDAGRSTAFRLVGSMTISAWINSTSYPRDDAAIVSNVMSDYGYFLGYQLDTTIDRGPRTVGFKLSDVCGSTMARYGTTPLRLNTWYHVAGVYDAQARTMDVYLNGELDDGFLLGRVTSRHRSARENVRIGSRSDLGGFEFAGSLDDVRIYSRALTQAEVQADMRGTSVDAGVATGLPVNARSSAVLQEDPGIPCSWSSEREDARIPGAIAAFGLLVAVVCVGLWPSAGPILGVLFSFAAGFVLLPITSSTLPPLNFWMFPLASLAGGLSIAVSVHRHNDLTR